MSSLFGDFETELTPPDALTACVDALDGLGWQVESVEAQRVECAVTSGAGDGGATIEVELSEAEAGTDIRLIGNANEDAALEEHELGAVLDQVADAIGEQIEKLESPAAEADTSEEEPPQGSGEGPAAEREEQPQEREEQAAQQLPAAGWFPDPHGSERQRYWDGENWTEHVHPQDAAAAEDDEQDEGGSESWIPRHWRSVAVGVLVFCVGGAVGAAVEPNDTKTSKRTQTETTQGPLRVQTQTVTQTQTVKAPAPNPSSSGPTVAGAAASSPAPSGGGTASTDCDPSYAPICLDPTVPDYDCFGKGDGPKFVDGPVTVVGNDHWQLDEADNDGLACE